MFASPKLHTGKKGKKLCLKLEFWMLTCQARSRSINYRWETARKPLLRNNHLYSPNSLQSQHFPGLIPSTCHTCLSVLNFAGDNFCALITDLGFSVNFNIVLFIPIWPIFKLCQINKNNWWLFEGSLKRTVTARQFWGPQYLFYRGEGYINEGPYKLSWNV